MEGSGIEEEVAGRHSVRKTRRVRFRCKDGKPRSELVFNSSNKSVRQKFSGKPILKIRKVSYEENHKIGEFAPFPQGESNPRMREYLREESLFKEIERLQAVTG